MTSAGRPDPGAAGRRRPRPGPAARHRRAPRGLRPRHRRARADFRVTAYDMVGHGWSDLPDRPVHHRRPLRPPARADGRAGHRVARTCPASRSAAGWSRGPPRTTPSASTGWCSTPRATSRTSRRSWPGCGRARLAAVARPQRRDRARPGGVPLPRQGDGHRRAGEPAPGGLLAAPASAGPIDNILVLQDPVARARFSWDPSWVRRVDRADAAAVDRPRPHRRARRGADCCSTGCPTPGCT